MAIGLVGRKCGMTRVFTDAGETVPVTVVEVLPEPHHPGQVARQRRLSRRAGHLRHAPPAAVLQGRRRPLRQGQRRPGPGAGRISPQRDGQDASSSPAASSRSTCSRPGEMVDVTGTTIGKGFAGVMKRHNFARHGPPTAPRCRTARRAPSASARRRAACSRASACPATWAWCAAPPRTCKVVEVDCRAQSAADPRRRAGCRGRPRIVRPSVKAARRAERKTVAPTKGGSRRRRRTRRKAGERSKRHEAQVSQRRAAELQVSDDDLRPRVQRGAGAPGVTAYLGGRPRRHQGAEDARRSARRRQEAVEPEGHRSGARRLDPQPIWVGGGTPSRPSRATSRRRSTARCIAARCAPCFGAGAQDRLVVTDSIELSSAARPSCSAQQLQVLALEQRADHGRGRRREAVPRGAQPAARGGDGGRRPSIP